MLYVYCSEFAEGHSPAEVSGKRGRKDDTDSVRIPNAETGMNPDRVRERYDVVSGN